MKLHDVSDKDLVDEFTSRLENINSQLWGFQKTLERKDSRIKHLESFLDSIGLNPDADLTNADMWDLEHAINLWRARELPPRPELETS